MCSLLLSLDAKPVTWHTVSVRPCSQKINTKFRRVATGEKPLQTNQFCTAYIYSARLQKGPFMIGRLCALGCTAVFIAVLSGCVGLTGSSSNQPPPNTGLQ